MRVFTRMVPVLAVAVVFVLFQSLYTVHETEQVIITQFGKPVGDPVTEPGLKFKTPFIQQVNSIEKRILEWDGRPNDMPTKDKLYISVDTFGRWRIRDPLTYFLRIRDERSAQSRLEDILGSETRTAVAKHKLIEIIRSTKDRKPLKDDTMLVANASVGVLLPIIKGRKTIEEEIFKAASAKLNEFGIELLDVRFKRINYNESVSRKIYERMISERQQIAERFRSEGAGEAAKIIGSKDRELREIESEAYKTIQTIRGDADAKATEVYASAYNRNADSVALYEFIKTMETYEKILDGNTTLLLTTESDLYRFMKSMQGND